MNDNNVEIEIKKENKKQFRKFVIVLLCALGVGAALGGGIEFIGEAIQTTKLEMQNLWRLHISELSFGVPIVVGIISIFSIIHTIVVIKKSKKQIKKAIETDAEEECFTIEKKLSYSLWEITLLLIFNFLGYSISIYIEQFRETGTTITGFIISLIIFFVVLILELFLQSAIVNQERILNPEKKGSAFDLGFQKKWMESSDEAELMLTYKAAFKAFQVIDILCVVLWVLLITIGLEFQIGCSSVIVVLLIWGVMKCVYFHYAIKYTNVK